MTLDAIETARLRAVENLQLMDDGRSQEAFDRIARLAQHLLSADYVLISYIDGQRQWYKSRIGTAEVEAAAEFSFCTYVIAGRETLIVEDAAIDQRFKSNPWVTDGRDVRFYAGAPLVTDDGHAVGTICVYSKTPRTMSAIDKTSLADLAELVMNQVKLDRQIAYFDSETGLPNKSKLLLDLNAVGRDRVVGVIDLMHADASMVAVRTLGFSFLVDVIKFCARTLSPVLGGASIYRVGLSSVAFFISENLSAAQDLIGAVSSMIADRLDEAGLTIKVRPSAGFRRLAATDNATAETIRSVLLASYDARQSHTAVREYDDERDRSYQRSFTLISDFPAALAAENQLSLVYQPRVDLSTGVWCGAEALVRWKHPELGNLSPGEFVPLLEKTGDIRDLTKWVMSTLFKQLATWHAAGLDVRCSFNISSEDLEDRGFAASLYEHLDSHGIPPGKVEIEIVESGPVMDSPVSVASIMAIADIGVEIAVDDFGTGYSNIAYLLNLPFSILKIDRSIIAEIKGASSFAATAMAIIQLSHHLGRRVVAEGVETQEVVDRLAEWGCDEIQGYFYSPPLSAAEFGSAYKSRSRNSTL